MSDITLASDSPLEEGDLDALIADTSSLIESVYNILDLPRRSTAAAATETTPPILGRRSHDNNNSGNSGSLARRSNSNSPKSPKTPCLGLASGSTLSTPSSQEIDREINRIDRFCEMLEQNLRSVSSGPQAERRLSTESPTTPARPASRSPRNTPPRNSEQEQSTTNQLRSLTPEAVIDLCDSVYIPTPMQRRPYSIFNTSDEVIIITPAADEIVDLCTPTYQRNNNVVRSRSNNRTDLQRNINIPMPTARQRLVPSRRSLSSFSAATSPQSPPPAIRSSSSISSSSSVQTGQQPRNNTPSGAKDNSGRVPFMCAVCMESCINNQPTSTKCGHVYCSNCIRRAIQMTHKCPICNRKVSANQLFRIYV